MIPSRSTLLLAIVAGLAIVGTTARLWWGVDFADEGQHVGSTVLTLVGGKPFVNELYIQQLASQLATPFAWVFLQLNQSLNGIVLAMRFAAWTAALTAAAYVYVRLRPLVTPPILRAGLALWPVLIWQVSLLSVYYNSVAHLSWYLFAVAWLTSARESRPRPLDLFVLGLSATIVCAAYWPLAPVVALGAVLWLRRTRGWHVRRGALWAGLGAGLAWIGSQLAGVTLADVMAAARFSSWSGDPRGLGPKVVDHLRLLWSAPPRPWSLVALGVAAWLVSAWRQRRWTAAHSWWALLALATTTVVLRFGQFPAGDGWLTTAGLCAVVLWGLGLKLPIEGLEAPWRPWALPAPEERPLSNPPPTSLDLVYLRDLSGLTALGALLMSALSSNGAAVFPILGSYLVWLALVPLSARLALGPAQVGVAVWLVLACSTGWTTVYGDAELWALTETIDGTPFAGLRTSPAHARVIRDIDADLGALPRGQTGLFLDGFAAGYTWGALRPSGQSLFLHPPHFKSQPRQLYVQALQQSKSLPDVVFEFNFFVHASGRRHNVDPLAPDPLRQALFGNGQYTLVHRRSDYTLWRRRDKP